MHPHPRYFTLFLTFVALLNTGLYGSFGKALTPSPQVQKHPTCDPEPAIQPILKEYDEARYTPNFKPDDWKPRLEEQIKNHPLSLHLHRAYQTLIRFYIQDPDAIKELTRHYEELAKSHSENVDFLYLYARAIMEDEPDRAVEWLEKALKKDPQYPWAHLALAYRYSYKEPKDLAKAEDHALKAIMQCPDNEDMHRYLRLISKPEYLKAIFHRIRTLLTSFEQGKNLTLYPTLWQIAFKMHPPSDHDEVRQMIREDLKHLEETPETDDFTWWDVRYKGYTYLNDTEALKTIENEIINRFPMKALDVLYKSYLDEINEYFEKEYDSDKDFKKLKAYIKKVDDLIEKVPNLGMLWFYRMNLLSFLKPVPRDELLKTAVKFVEVSNQNPNFTLRDPEIVAGRYLVRADTALDKAEAFIAQGIEKLEKEHKKLESLPDSEEKRSREQMYIYRRWQAEQIRLEVRRKRKQWDKVEDSLDQLEHLLQSIKTLARVSEDIKRDLTVYSTIYWEERLNFAVERDHLAEAMVYFEQWVRESAGNPDYERFKKVYTEKIHDLWKKQGASEKSWQLWLKQLEQPSIGVAEFKPWEAIQKPLPDFQAYDLNGNQWNREDLKGKYALINLWATSCGPCVSELPHFQELYNEMKNEADLKVLSFNVDDDVGLVKPFMEKNGYTFPVILAGDTFLFQMKEPAIPQLILVDPEGNIRAYQVGFGGSPDEWKKQILDMIQSVKDTKDNRNSDSS